MVDIAALCGAMGVPVTIGDPFDLIETRETLNRLLEEPGVKVLILKQSCALSPEKRGRSGSWCGWTIRSAWERPAAAIASARGFFRCPGPLEPGEKKGRDRRGDLRRLRVLRRDLPGRGYLQARRRQNPCEGDLGERSVQYRDHRRGGRGTSWPPVCCRTCWSGRGSR